MFSIQEIIELAIQLERNGEAFCREALKKNIGPELAGIFRWMAEEESKHIEWLERLKRTIPETSQNSHMEEMGRAVLSGILGDQRFSLSDMDSERISDVDALVAKLIEFENDTVLFYEIIRTAVSDEQTLKYLDMIISEEKQHSQKLKVYIENKRQA